MLVTMPSTSSQYLQVPKIIPHRKSRSRSRSRSQPRGVVVPLESPTKEVFVAKPSVQLRTPSPAPAPAPAPPPPSLEVRASKPPSPPTIPQKRSMDDLVPTPSPPPTSYGGMDGFQSTLADATAAPSPPGPIDLNGSIYTDDDDEPMPDSPAPPPPLRQRIIGAWKLDSYIAYPTPTSPIQRPTFPMTKNVSGFIMYTPDGYMSAQMLIPGQQSFKRGEGEEPQWAEAGKRFFGYCGPYYITREGAGGDEVLRHTFQVCNLPGWVGDLQVRTWRFEEEGQVLVLGSEAPTEIKGDRRVPVLKWRRAKDNSRGAPPPPTPQIKISGPGEP